jgi:hypothetical protein
MDSARYHVVSLRFDKEAFWNTNRGLWKQTAVTVIKTLTRTSSGIVQKESLQCVQTDPPHPHLKKPRLYRNHKKKNTYTEPDQPKTKFNFSFFQTVERNAKKGY